MRRPVLLAGSVVACLSLLSCGDGEDSTQKPVLTAPGIPILKLEPGFGSLNFSWNDASGATTYKFYEDPDGSGFVQIGGNQTRFKFSEKIMTWTYDWSHARYRVDACNQVGCTSSKGIQASAYMLKAIGYFKASNTDANDYFGSSVALSSDGTTMAVGARGEGSNAIGINGNQNNNDAANSGAVYVFRKVGDSWSQEAYLKSSNSEAGDSFGYDVSLSSDGNTLAVSANLEASNASGINQDQTDNSMHGSGAVYIFTRNGSIWNQEAYIKASNPDINDNFGEFLRLSSDGNTLAVSAPGEDSNATGIGGDQTNNAASNSGAVYVFTRSGSTWSQQAYLKSSNSEANDVFGWTIALSADGNTLAVGADGEDSNATGVGGDETNNTILESGAAYIFVRTGSTWSQQAYIKASNPDSSDFFGAPVVLSGDGNILAVGARSEDSNAIGIGGDQSNNDAVNSGAVYIYTRSGSTWSQEAYVKASNTDREDNFGKWAALSSDGSRLAVGAFLESSGATGMGGDQSDNSELHAGAVYIFSHMGTTWSQVAYVKAPNTDASDLFGEKVALSGDGKTLAISASYEDSNAIGVNGNEKNNDASSAGAVYLY